IAGIVGPNGLDLASAELERDHARLRAGHLNASVDRRHRAGQVEDSVGDPTAVDPDTREDRPGLGKLHVGARVDLDDEVLVKADLAEVFVDTGDGGGVPWGAPATFSVPAGGPEPGGVLGGHQHIDPVTGVLVALTGIEDRAPDT